MGVMLRISVLQRQVAPDIKVPFQKGMTVRQVLESAYESTAPLQKVLRFGVQYFGAKLGYELTLLDGIAPQTGADGESFLFWEMLVNGHMSATGMDQTRPGDGDLVEWTYTSYQPRHTGTRYEELRDLFAA